MFDSKSFVYYLHYLWQFCSLETPFRVSIASNLSVFEFILSTELQRSSSSHRVLEYFHCTFLLSDMYFSDDDSPLDHSGLFYLQSTPKRLADGPANVLLLLFVHVKSESLIGLESSCLWQTFTVKGYGLFGITLVLKRAGGSGAMAKVDFSLHLVL